MANEEQMSILKQGVTAWNEWRRKNPAAKINLSGTELTEVDLSGANLKGAHLKGANLSRANLNGAHLSEANLSGVNLNGTNLSGVNLNGADLSEADLNGADLSGAKLNMAHLGEANLNVAHLSGADLRGANLNRAHLSGANLNGANLSKASLNGAYLSGALLIGATLHAADLIGANLSAANLSGADLSGADLNNCSLGSTTVGDVDLSLVKGLETVNHKFASTIGIDTVYKSKGKIPEVFLRGAGVPENLITFMHSLVGRAFDSYSCFVIHSTKDKPFCIRLHADLQAKGVRLWYFPEDAKWGEPVWGEIERSTKPYDKLIAVLSENSLQSKPLLRDLQHALDREDIEHKIILYPITLDRYVFDKWEHVRKTDVIEKVVGDFGDWDNDAAKYQKAIQKLLQGLQAEDRED